MNTQVLSSEAEGLEQGLGGGGLQALEGGVNRTLDWAYLAASSPCSHCLAKHVLGRLRPNLRILLLAGRKACVTECTWTWCWSLMCGGSRQKQREKVRETRQTEAGKAEGKPGKTGTAVLQEPPGWRQAGARSEGLLPPRTA